MKRRKQIPVDTDVFQTIHLRDGEFTLLLLEQGLWVEMHDVGFFVIIQYADILQLIWPIINTDIYVYVFPTPKCRDDQTSSVVEFTYSIIMQTLTMLAHRQMQAWNTKLEMMKYSFSLQKKKNTWTYVKHVLFIYDNCF